MKGRDELADLADHFNQMVERLEATTVSKAALETSESQLRVTNEELRRQIADRQRAEAAERSLRAELHRNEMLTTMGSLVAGVAHEVRNPLFGISSTVDALEARLTELGRRRPMYDDHLRVLRVELTRLTTLMQDLLEAHQAAQPRETASQDATTTTSVGGKDVTNAQAHGLSKT